MKEQEKICICPAGYHIPTDLEWSRYEYCIENNIAPTGTTTLATFQDYNLVLRGSATAGVGPGDKMKVTGWPQNTNTSGFSALFAGMSSSGASWNIGANGYYWSLTENSDILAWSRSVAIFQTKLIRDNANNKTNGLSVRCLQN